MKRGNRIFYLGMVTTDAYAKTIDEPIYSGAAARKMFLVARAMRSVGLRATVMSLPYVGMRGKRRFYGSVLTVEAGVPGLFAPTFRAPLLRKIAGPFTLAGFALRRIASADTVIVYNHAFEYLPTLLVLWLRGQPLVQDIEDAPTGEEPGVRGIMNRIAFAMTSILTRPRKMVVADHVAQGLNLKDYVAIRGVAMTEADTDPATAARKWDDLRAGGPLNLHFGGTLITETGVHLFCDAVALLAQNQDRLSRPVRFKVTGIGDIDLIRALQKRMGLCEKIKVELMPELSKVAYLALIETCHASLSLKRPGIGMSNTTFPSKVIEITASGLALVSTRLGDVPELFAEDTAYYLSDYTARDLVEIFLDMAANPHQVEQVAKASHETCTRLFSLQAVGAEMKRLFDT